MSSWKGDGPMRKFSACVILGCCLLLGTTLSQADLRQPNRYMPGQDSELVQVTNTTDGVAWSAWTYRNGAETDIAIVSLSPDGKWSEPLLVGLDDGEDQGSPVLAVDGWGTVYLAYTEKARGRLMLTGLRITDHGWSRPIQLARSAAGVSSPVLLVAASRRLVVGYLEGEQTVRLLERRLMKPPTLPSMNDGPDPVGSTPDDNGGDEGDEATEEANNNESITQVERTGRR